MNVELISITKPEIKDIKKAEDLVAYCARVSNPSNQLNLDTAPKLLKFLINHKHWSPFEMVDMCVEIKTSRAIAAQILRHRSFSFQEFSQRYSSATEYEDIELRLQGNKNRQVGENLIPMTHPAYEEINHLIAESISISQHCYETMIDNGIAKEVARMVLPLNTQTTIYMKGTLRSWIHYIQLRTEQNTQKEHRQIAEKCKK
ncbi:MAG: FAD-dependent thymidylate synthase, partial [Proteobacteria bacterium]|nr:FAD-dependent thymidylate synthase [Pseudomonadota bacterium]